MNSGSAPTLILRDVSCARNGVMLAGVNLELAAQRLHVLTGGAAEKDLLLRVLGLLEPPDSGTIWVGGVNCAALDDAGRQEVRARAFGYLFAAPYLLPSFSVVENLAMPLFKLLETSPSEARDRSGQLLDFFGLCGREEDRAGDLSPAEQHIVALARALITNPDVLIVDSLDAHVQGADLQRFSALLREVGPRWGTMVIATASDEWRPDPGEHVIVVRDGVVQAGQVTWAAS